MSLPVGGWHVDSAPTKFFLVDILSDVSRREQPEHNLSGRGFPTHTPIALRLSPTQLAPDCLSNAVARSDDRTTCRVL